MADFDCHQSVEKDTLEQFRGKPNIQVLHEVLATQLQDVYDFFMELNLHRNLRDAVGTQLDGIGDIVVLDRAEASKFAKATGLGDASDDEVYRKYLIHKILKNTCNCTYPDLIKAFRMFWDKPLYYSEDPKYPATMFFKTGELSIEDHVENLLHTPIIKAAGVGIHVMATVCFPEMWDSLHVGGSFGTAITLSVPEMSDEMKWLNMLRLGGGMALQSVLPIPEQT